MKHNYAICGERIRLSPLSEDDAERLRILRNRNSCRFIDSAEISADAQLKWYQKYIVKPCDYMFSAVYKATNQWIGAVGLYNVDTVCCEAEFGRLVVDKEAAGIGGLGVDVTRAVCQIGFEQLGLRCIILEVYSNNIPAIKTYQRSGFTEVGSRCDNNGKKLLLMEIRKERK